MKRLVQLPTYHIHLFLIFKLLFNGPVNVLTYFTPVDPEEGLFCKPKYRVIFWCIYFLLYVFRLVCLSLLTAERISRSVYLFATIKIVIRPKKKTFVEEPKICKQIKKCTPTKNCLNLEILDTIAPLGPFFD